MFEITPTTELQAQKEVDFMVENSTTGLNQLKFYADQAYNAFWYGDISPIIKVQLLGDKALEVFTTSALTQSFIKKLDPNWIIKEIPEGYEVVFNEYGSAIINKI